KELIERNCTVELKGAKFDRKSLDLLPEAGSCEACPKRVGNLQQADPEGYEGARADVCTDPACFRAKAAAHQQRLRDQAEASGKSVMTGKEAKTLFPYGGRLDYQAPYVELEGKCHEDPKARTYRKLVGKQLKDDVVLAEDPDGNLHSLLPKDKVRKVLKAEHGIGVAGNGASSKEDARWKRQQAEERRKALAGTRAALEAQGLLAAAAERDFGDRDTRLSGAATLLLRRLVIGLVEQSWNDACQRVIKRRGLAGGRP